MKITTVDIKEDGNYLVNETINVPNVQGNRHRVMIQEWIDEGNTPEPYVEPELSYSVRRAAAYASLQEQADMQYWDAVNGTTLWQEHIAKVKSDIPKE